MWLKLRNVEGEKKSFSFPPPWKFQTTITSSRTPDPPLFSDPGLLINLPRNWLSQELDHKESWESKNWCFWTVVLEKILESLLDSKETQPVHSKGNQSWIFIGRTDAEAETPVLWSPDVKNWLIWKDPDTGKDWRQEEKGTTEDEMVGWHHWLSGHEFE